MGQEVKKEQVTVQISDKAKRKHLKEIITCHLKVCLATMTYFHKVASDRHAKLICTKSIKKLNKALVELDNIKHTELLEYLYSSYVGNNVILYSVSADLVLSSKLKYWDTDKGIEEFKTEMEEKRQERLAKAEQREKNREAIAKARAEGKQVDMVYDKDTKSVRPVIVEKCSKA